MRPLSGQVKMIPHDNHSPYSSLTVLEILLFTMRTEINCRRIADKTFLGRETVSSVTICLESLFLVLSRGVTLCSRMSRFENTFSLYITRPALTSTVAYENTSINRK